MLLNVDNRNTVDIARLVQRVAVGEDSKPQAVAAIGTVLSGAMNVLAALVGKDRGGDTAERINPTSLLYAGILLAKVSGGDRPEEMNIDGAAMLKITIDVGHSTFKSALEATEKLVSNVDEYLDPEMLAGIRTYQACKEQGPSALPESLRGIVSALHSASGRRLH